MSTEELRQVHNQLRSAQDKYTYFLLFVAASAIAFSIQITKTDTFSFSLIPLGLAVVSWGGSFFSGCRNIQYVNSVLFANYDYLKVQSGSHPKVGSMLDHIEEASNFLLDDMDRKSRATSTAGKWQFRLLVLGGVLFAIWHIIEMWIRTSCNTP